MQISYLQSSIAFRLRTKSLLLGEKRRKMTLGASTLQIPLWLMSRPTRCIREQAWGTPDLVTNSLTFIKNLSTKQKTWFMRLVLSTRMRQARSVKRMTYQRISGKKSEIWTNQDTITLWLSLRTGTFTLLGEGTVWQRLL